MQRSSNKTNFDATIISQKILSCVYRLEQKLGIGCVCDILRGSKAKYISEDHKKLSTYGIIHTFSKEQLKDLIKQLVKLGYIKTESDRYSTLKLTKKSVNLLKGKEKVFLQQPPDWFEVMRQNATKQHITIQATISALNNVTTLEQAARVRKLTVPTIIEHIELAAFLEKTIDISKFIDSEKIITIENAFNEIGLNKLLPVRAKLGGDFSYDELRLVRAKIISDKYKAA